MNLSTNIVLKENYTFLVTDADGQIKGGERGLYSHDTRFLNHLSWDFTDDLPGRFQTLVAHSAQPNTAVFHYSCIDGPSQIIGIHRTLSLLEGKLVDILEVENTASDKQSLELRLDLSADFLDLFEARGLHQIERNLSVSRLDKEALTFSYEDETQARYSTKVRQMRGESTGWSPGTSKEVSRIFWRLVLEPGTKLTIELSFDLEHPALDHSIPGPSYENWKLGFPEALIKGPLNQDQVVLGQAIQDLRALMLFSPQGNIPAAGIPWFVAAFGRDSLLTAYMLLPHHPWVSKGVLEYLGHHQGKELNSVKGEEPGKIMHEIRFGELSRRGIVPHSPYYGTIDATPLYIILLERLWQVSGDDQLISQFRTHWEAAFGWMTTHGDPDGDGFLEYVAAEPGKGLAVQSWKDSDDSMSHEDGTLAQGYIRPAEVQGYAYGAYRAGSAFYRVLGDPVRATELEIRAEQLKTRFDEVFWIDSIGCYAMALDGQHKPLGVKSSNTGQLLWTGIVPEARVSTLAATLMGPELYSGWGIRTLGTKEKRYNPVSYHNGSVWPHDTALTAMGLHEYGYIAEAGRLVRDLFDLAASQPDTRLPELIAGYPRGASPPVPYPVACRPQAWDAAALVYLQPLLVR